MQNQEQPNPTNPTTAKPARASGDKIQVATASHEFGHEATVKVSPPSLPKESMKDDLILENGISSFDTDQQIPTSTNAELHNKVFSAQQATTPRSSAFMNHPANAHPPVSSPVTPNNKPDTLLQVQVTHQSGPSSAKAELTPTTPVYIFMDDLFFTQSSDKTDLSLNKEIISKLDGKCALQFVVAEGTDKERANAVLKEMLGDGVTAGEKSLKEVVEEGKKLNIRIIISDELLGKQSPALRVEIVNCGYCFIFASLLTQNESFVGIDYAKTQTGRGTLTIPSKLLYSHIPNRTRVGFFIENSYYRPAMLKLLQDTESVEYVPVLFWDVPTARIDFLIHRATNCKAVLVLNNDPKIKKQLDNYIKFEEKSKKTVFVDKLDHGKVCLYRAEFMEALKEQCEIENATIGKEVFEVPWTRGGDYLDVLKNSKLDLPLVKLAAGIPYPLITKSDLACGHPSTHDFFLLKEAPTNWADLKNKILETYKGKPFLVQAFMPDSKNTIFKGMSIFGTFGYDLREGLKDAKPLDAENGSLLPQGTKSLPGDKSAVDEQIVEHIKNFQLNLAKRLHMNLMGIDFLIDTAKGRILPIDLNKMPRLEHIPNIEDIFARVFARKPEELQSPL